MDYSKTDQSQKMVSIYIQTIFHEISPCNPVPDAEKEVLIYDGYLDDVVKGSLDLDEHGNPVWLEQMTGDPLRDPQYWADVPFPGDGVRGIII